jgi:alkylation response protein AidB-like acyl-CoA dehydrogenase
VRFAFTDDQVAFRDAVRDLLDKHCPPEAVRAAWAAEPGDLDRSVWGALDEMGVTAALVPETAGGLGLDECSLALVLEETGRAALPHPVVESVLVAAPLLAAHGELPGAGSDGGGMPVDSADPPSPFERQPAVGTGSLVASDLGGPNVACALDADRFLLHDRATDALHLVEPDGVVLTPLDTVDGARRAARLTWQPVDGTLLTDDPAEVALAFDRGAFGTAAQLLGLAQRMLDLTVAYVGQREQFGQPVGAFQAVKHHLADALKTLAFARPVVHRAAHSLAVGADSRARDVSMAKAMASDAARFVGRQALQCHGAIGYTVEADLHLYLKRSWALAAAWGDAPWHRDRVATTLGI